MASPELTEFEELAYHIGAALITWQHVEEAHFALFMKMLGAPQAEIGSVVYYSIESFKSRHRMVGRMAHYFLLEKADKIKWENNKGGLKKELKDANNNRNKLAHYAIQYDIIGQKTLEDGSIELEFSQPRLQPSPDNLVSRLLGRTPDKPDYNLTPTEIRQYILVFRDLAVRLQEFQRGLPLPKPQLGSALSRAFGLPLGQQS